jgi:hypothetical protein
MEGHLVGRRRARARAQRVFVEKCAKIKDFTLRVARLTPIALMRRCGSIQGPHDQKTSRHQLGITHVWRVACVCVCGRQAGVLV